MGKKHTTYGVSGWDVPLNQANEIRPIGSMYVCHINGLPWPPSIYPSDVSINLPYIRIRHGHENPLLMVNQYKTEQWCHLHHIRSLHTSPGAADWNDGWFIRPLVHSRVDLRAIFWQVHGDWSMPFHRWSPNGLFTSFFSRWVIQCGPPQWCERWFINPMNYSYKYHKP